MGSRRARHHYPDQFLGSRNGDCDDCTVLYCSLLENVGIPTALVDAPGHIFMMFDSGIPAERQERLCLSRNQYVVYDDRVWIPVEITMLGEPFAVAWQSAAESTSYLARTGQMRIYEVAEAWGEYSPARRPSSTVQPLPDSAAVAAYLPGDLEELVLQRDTYLRRRFHSRLRRNPEDHAIRSSLARAYVYLGRLDEAVSEYEKLLTTDHDPSSVHNDLGIALLVAGRSEEALTNFARAAELQPDDAGYRRNYEFARQQLDQIELVAVAESGDEERTQTRGSLPFVADRFEWSSGR